MIETFSKKKKKGGNEPIFAKDKHSYDALFAFMWSCAVTWASKDQKHRAQPDAYLWDRSRGDIMKGVLGGERVGSYRLNHFLIVL